VRILATGCTGLTGRHFLRATEGGHEVVALTRREPPAELEPLADWVVADLASPLDRSALPESIDSVVHLAQSERFRELPERADDVFAVNVAATFGLLDYARRAGASSFVLASTGGVYARSDEPLRESDPVETGDFYFRSKHLAEQLLKGFSEHFRTVVLRPFFIYGPGESQLLIPRLAASVRAGEKIRIEGERGLLINPIYAADAAAAVESAASGDAQGVVNVAGPENVSISGLVDLLGELLGGIPEVEHSGEEPGVLLGDTSRMRSELGAEPVVGIREGLEALLAD